MLRDSTRNLIDLPKLWKWIQFYINNWRLNADETQAVLWALEYSYWQGVISWADFVKCQHLLGSSRSAHKLRATDLALALTQLGRVVQGRYQIDEVRGFVDQGILLQAQYAGQTYPLLCLTTPQEVTREIIKQIPEINRLALPFAVNVRSVIKTERHLYLVLSAVVGTPLSAWLVAQYPTGAPAQVAQMLLQQIYQMLKTVHKESGVVASIHPGQLFIDPDSLMLQLIPLSISQPQHRGRLYQAPNMVATDQSTFIGYRLMAIAYELFTGSVPNQHYQPMQTIIQQCEYLSRGQKKQIERCLLTHKNMKIDLSQAAMILDVAQKRPLLDATLMTLAILCAISAMTWQGMRYLPTWLSEGPVLEVKTFVLEQAVHDQHVNGLKAAFFTHTEQANIAGARASWRALQELLPSDDVFIQKIGPEQLAQSYLRAAEQMMQRDAAGAGVLVRAATRVLPTHELSPHLRALAALDPPVTQAVMTTTPPADVAPIDDAFSDQIIALTEVLMEPLPPLPETVLATPVPDLLENVLLRDTCVEALTAAKSQSALCMDALSDVHFGPRLLAVRNQDHTLVTTQETISVADYNQYCLMSGVCAPYNETSAPEGLDLGLGDVSSTVQEYNTYCMVSGLCEPLPIEYEPMVTLSPQEIQAYANWLSQETGFEYRLPTIDELKQIMTAAKQMGGISVAENTAEWLLDHTGQWVTSLQVEDEKSVAFRLVRNSQ